MTSPPTTATGKAATMSAPEPKIVTTRYKYGFNVGETGEHEVLRVTQYDRGVYRTEILLSLRSEIKAKAIVMILDAPEGLVPEASLMAAEDRRSEP